MTKVVKMTNREILENATKRLDKAGIAEAGNDAWLLFSEAFGRGRKKCGHSGLTPKL